MEVFASNPRAFGKAIICALASYESQFNQLKAIDDSSCGEFPSS